MAKCENCYHAGVCIHRINYEDYDCECANYKDKSHFIAIESRSRLSGKYNLDSFGKTVFLSREEAERALEECEKNG